MGGGGLLEARRLASGGGHNHVVGVVDGLGERHRVDAHLAQLAQVHGLLVGGGGGGGCGYSFGQFVRGVGGSGG